MVIYLLLGDIGDKFYIILKGKVSILLDRQIKINLTEEEYYMHLLKLRKYNEINFVNKTIDANKKIFNIPNNNLELLVSNHVNKIRKTYNQLTYEEESILDELSLLLNATPKESEELEDCDSYLKLFLPKFLKRRGNSANNIFQTEKKEIVIITYVKITSLTSGEYFGDMALEDKYNKRTATIYSDEETHLGSLDRTTYDLSVKVLNVSIKKNNIAILMSSCIFNYFTKKYFERHFYNYFKIESAETRKKIINEGDDISKIYFIKNGEFNVSMKKSLVQINDMIVYYGGVITKKLEEDEKMESDVIFKKFMHDKKISNISIQQQKDIIGLDDYIYDGKYGFTVENRIDKSEYWTIERRVRIL